MPIHFLCSSCGQKYNAPESAAGKSRKCVKCGEPMFVPLPPVQEAVDLFEEELQSQEPTSQTQSSRGRSVWTRPIPSLQWMHPVVEILVHTLQIAGIVFLVACLVAFVIGVVFPWIGTWSSLTFLVVLFVLAAISGALTCPHALMRFIRRAVWGGCIGWAIHSYTLFQRMLGKAESAIQETSLASMACVMILFGFVLAFAIDAGFLGSRE